MAHHVAIDVREVSRKTQKRFVCPVGELAVPSCQRNNTIQYWLTTHQQAPQGWDTSGGDVAWLAPHALPSYPKLVGKACMAYHGPDVQDGTYGSHATLPSAWLGDHAIPMPRPHHLYPTLAAPADEPSVHNLWCY